MWAGLVWQSSHHPVESRLFLPQGLDTCPTLYTVLFSFVPPSSAHSFFRTLDAQALVLSRTNTDPKGHHGPALLKPEALPGFLTAPPSGRSQNCPFGDETVCNDIVLTAVDTSHLNPLPDQEAPTDTAFHRARYSCCPALEDLPCPKKLLEFAEAEAIQLGLSWL